MKIDWDEFSKVVLAVGFLSLAGVLAAFALGFYAITLVFDVFLGRWLP